MSFLVWYNEKTSAATEHNFQIVWMEYYHEKNHQSCRSLCESTSPLLKMSVVQPKLKGWKIKKQLKDINILGNMTLIYVLEIKKKNYYKQISQ